MNMIKSQNSAYSNLLTQHHNLTDNHPLVNQDKKGKKNPNLRNGLLKLLRVFMAYLGPISTEANTV
jgi:hypothetical protein